MRLDVDENLEFTEETAQFLRQQGQAVLVEGPSREDPAQAAPRAAHRPSLLWRGFAAMLGGLEQLLRALGRMVRWLLRISWRWSRRLAMLWILVTLCAWIPPSGLFGRQVAQAWGQARAHMLTVPGVARAHLLADPWIAAALETGGRVWTRLARGRSASPRGTNAGLAGMVDRCRSVRSSLEKARWWRPTGPPVNLRRGPSTRFAVRTILLPGELGRVRGAPRDGWLQLALYGGITGWVYAPLGEPLLALGCATTWLAPRTDLCRAPRRPCSVLHQTERRQRFEVLEDHGKAGWRAIRLNRTHVGWVHTVR